MIEFTEVFLFLFLFLLSAQLFMSSAIESECEQKDHRPLPPTECTSFKYKFFLIAHTRWKRDSKNHFLVMGVYYFRTIYTRTFMAFSFCFCVNFIFSSFIVGVVYRLIIHIHIIVIVIGIKRVWNSVKINLKSTIFTIF